MSKKCNTRRTVTEAEAILGVGYVIQCKIVCTSRTNAFYSFLIPLQRKPELVPFFFKYGHFEFQSGLYMIRPTYEMSQIKSETSSIHHLFCLKSSSGIKLYWYDNGIQIFVFTNTTPSKTKTKEK